jgi:hypothetical protein
MPTVAEKIETIKNSLESEAYLIVEKLPWWEQALTWTLVGAFVITSAAACGLITIGSLGTSAPACILGLIALVVVLIKLVFDLLSSDTEGRALEVKLGQLRALRDVAALSEGE